MCSQTDRQRQPHFLPKWYLFRSISRARNIKILNFEKVVREVLDIYDSCVHGQIDRPITQFFNKVETYVDRLLVPEIYVIKSFVKIVWAVLEIYENCIHGQTDNPIFYKGETYLDRLLVTEICIIPNFVKIVKAVL